MKKLLAIILVLLFSLSGCFMSDNSTTTVQSGDKTLTFTKDTVYLLYEETISYADGTEYFRKFKTRDTVPGTNYLADGTLFINEVESGPLFREYDTEGNLIAENDGTTDIRYELTYDEGKHIVKKITFVDDAETTTEEYTYTDGLLTEIVVTENGQLTNRFVTEYDANGNRDQTTQYDSAGAIAGITRYERKESKEIASCYTPDDVLLGYSHNTYGYHGKLVKEERYSPDAELLVTSIWNYVGNSYSSLNIE